MDSFQLTRCSKGGKCNWKCFALDKNGIGAGRPDQFIDEWIEAHSRHCGGILEEYRATKCSTEEDARAERSDSELQAAALRRHNPDRGVNSGGSEHG
jgi:hypothetical protein